jgi:hypothetical protein
MLGPSPVAVLHKLHAAIKALLDHMVTLDQEMQV